MGKKVRKPIFEGQAYPAGAKTMKKKVQALFDQPRNGLAEGLSAPLAIVVPRGPFEACAEITAHAYAATAESAARRVVILAPSDNPDYSGIALPSQDCFAAAGAEMPLHKGACKSLVSAGLAEIDDTAQESTPAIERQIPFLQHVHPKARIIPLVVGRVSADKVKDVVNHLASDGAGETLFVATALMARHGDAETTRKAALDMASLIESGRARGLRRTHCDAAPILSGLMTADCMQHARPGRIAVLQPGNATPIAAWRIHAGGGQALSLVHQRELLSTARKVLEMRASGKSEARVAFKSYPPELQSFGACFVTLETDGVLRGCVGSPMAQKPLVLDVIDHAVKAGFADCREGPLSLPEVGKVKITLSVLSGLTPVEAKSEAAIVRHLEKGETGLMLHDGERAALLLPREWQKYSAKGAFLKALKRKFGAEDKAWSENWKLFEFRSEDFSEEPELSEEAAA